MKFTRRQFLQGTTSATAGLLLPLLSNQSLAHISDTDGPKSIGSTPFYVTLVYDEILSSFHHTRGNEYSGYLFSIFGPVNTPKAPVMTHMEAAAFLGYDDLDDYARENLMVDENRVPVAFNPEDEAELGIYFKDWYYPYDYSEATEYAYRWLGSLDLSLRNKGRPGLEGIEFIDKSVGQNGRFANDCPRYAKAPDTESLLLVQKNLETFGIGTIVQYEDRGSSWPISQRNQYEASEFQAYLNSAEEYQDE